MPSNATQISASQRQQERSFPTRALLSALIGVIVAAAIVLVGFNAFIYQWSPSFFNQAEPAIEIPDTHGTFVPQDIDYLESSSSWLFSGYDSAHNASALYRRNADGTIAKLFVETPDGAPYVGHGSGITHAGEWVYLTYEAGYMAIRTRLVATAADGDTVFASGSVDVGFEPAFLNVQDDMLYAGVFYNGDNYLTPPEMEINTPDGTVNHAIMYAFAQSDATGFGFSDVPEAAYSIPDKAQGVCLTSQGYFVFSTSYGFAPSHLLFHDATLASPDTYVANGASVPLFCFDSTTLRRELMMPPMSEGIINLNGKIYVPFESACNKYIFGKLYGAGQVYALSADATSQL